ncbi:MAG: VWA domain-containing protein [Bacteroidetes bacterium]|nr:VWA domain-containing protein [Bacteroidota bacterium]
MPHISFFRIPFVLLLFFSVTVKGQIKTGRPVDIVIAMDLSSSSNGLIDHLRNHIWDYWYTLSNCNPQPNYRIAVVTYARFSYGKQNGYTRIVKDLSTDFEKLSSLLYKIPSRIEKGDQYVGATLNTCLKKISWSKDPEAIKMIFLVGNGDVTTGTIDIDETVDKLVANNIIVNTVYCTVPGEKKAIKGWERIALKGKGKISSMSIRNKYFDRLNGFDMAKFRALNKKFNKTYLWYGPEGKARFNRMVEVDNKAYITNTEGFRYRILHKISDDYQRTNNSWDLVDLYSRNPLDFIKVDRKTMIDTCRKMNNDQLKAFIIFKKYERKKIGAMMAEMIINKELKDKEEGQIVNKTMPTLDIVTLNAIRDVLREESCECPKH